MLVLFIVDNGEVYAFSREVEDTEADTLRGVLAEAGFTPADVYEMFLVNGSLTVLDSCE